MADIYQLLLLLPIWILLLNAAFRDRSPVESSIYKRDTTCSTATNYTTPNGLVFDIYCDYEIGGSYNNTLISTSNHSATASSLEECMEQCSVKQPACRAVDYNYSSSTCYYKNIDYTSPNSSSPASSILHSAIVVPSFLVASDTSCPYDNNTLITASGGAQFTVDCGMNIMFNDFSTTSYTYPYHADSLDDCVDYCAAAHPLCYAVTWNADMLYGWANCYLKTPAPNADQFETDQTVGVIAHSALFNVSNMTPLITTCPSSTTYKATGSDIFTLECDSWVSTGSNGTSLHTDSLTSCMESCAASNDSCSAVVFDYKIADGFDNCYLQTRRGLFLSSGSTHAAYISTYGNGTIASPPPTTSKKSLGWIAGPIIGAVAAIGLIIFGWLFWRRRQKRRADALSRVYLTAIPEEESYSGTYVSAQDGGTSELPNSQVLMCHELSELGKQQPLVHELQ